MARRSSGGVGGALALAAVGGIAWLVSEHGQTLLIVGIAGAVVWFLFKSLPSRGQASPEPLQEEQRRSGPAPDYRFREATPAADCFRGSPSRSSGRAMEQPASVLSAGSTDRYWVPASGNAEVKGRRIGGMVYVGSGLRAPSGIIDPALIDPSLPVSNSLVSPSIRLTNYWPSYSDISPDARSAYLAWLATGRSDPSADVGYVFLYFYGLERRALVDAQASAAAKADVPAIVREIERLLALYPKSRSLQNYGGSLLDLLQASSAPERLYVAPPPPLRAGSLGFVHRLGLAQCAAAGDPLPAEWAFAWLMAEPTTRLRTPARRCPAEFEALFKERYGAAQGGGMVLPKNRTQLRLEYVPASRGLSLVNQFKLKLDLPDVSVLTSPVKKLQAIADECQDALAGYSRAVGAEGSKAASVEALAELPVSLWPAAHRERLQKMRDIAKQTGRPAPVPLATVLSWLPPIGELTRAKVKTLYRALGQAGLAMEPDIRLGAALPGADATVYLFATDQTEPPKSSSRYSAAALALQLAVAVAASDGDTSEKERDLLARQLEEWLHLDAAERQRLHALLRHLAASPPKLTGLKGTIETLDVTAREAIGEFLALVAQSDEQVTPAEIKMLEKIFKLLKLQAESLYSKVHAAATEPVTVRPGAASTGLAIPPKPQAKKAKGIQLDPAKVAALQADSERVSAILGAIFTAEEDAEPVPVVEVEQAPSNEPALMGLDEDHAAFVRTLLSRPHWTRAELEELAEDRGLMVDGTLERINEASFDAFDKPFLEGDDPVALNQEVVHELAQ